MRCGAPLWLLLCALLVLLLSLGRRRGSAPASSAAPPVPDLSDLLHAARSHAQTLSQLSEAASEERVRISAALSRGPEASAGLEEAGSQGDVVSSPRCADGCTSYGNCNELTGECTCGLSRSGANCAMPTMPACSLQAGPGAPREGWTRGRSGARRAFGDGTLEDGGSLDDVINLSYLASENFWGGLRDVTEKDPRRKSIRHRWVGMVTCDCVEQVRGSLPCGMRMVQAISPPPRAASIAAIHRCTLLAAAAGLRMPL
eukprot:scaffold117993_cov34-Tisochrysis_lutea.AAC.3